MLNKSLYSSKTVEWSTPQFLFDKLNAEFNFTLDVCATDTNHKCNAYFTVETDGLLQDWTGNCWMNPPYGRVIGQWMHKAYTESQKGATVVCLIPVRTDTKWWHNWAMKATEIRLFNRRIKFGDAKTNAPFPSCLAIFKPGKNTPILTVSDV